MIIIGNIIAMNNMPAVIFEYILLEDGVELALENGDILSLE